MDVKKKYEIVRQFEEEFEPFDKVFLRVPIWPVLRQSILLSIESQWNRKPINSVQSIFQKLWSKVRLFFNFFILNFFRILGSFFRFMMFSLGLKKINILYLSGTNVKRIKKNNRHYDVFCDPIVDQLSTEEYFNKYTVLETSNEYNFKHPSYHRSINIQLLIHLSHLLSFGFSLFLKVFKNKELNEYVNRANSYFDSKIEGYSPKSPFSLTFELVNIYILSSFFKRIMKNAKVKFVFMICYYGPQGMAFCKASRELGIPSVDIQHGVQGEFHYGYSNYKNLTDKSLKLFPTDFWVWSEKEKEIIHCWTGEKPIKATVMGNLYLNETIKAPVPDILQEFKRDKKKKFNKVAFYSLDDSPVEINDFVRNALKYQDIFWMFKFHPRTSKKDVDKITKQLSVYANCDVDVSNSFPLSDLLKIIDWHVTDMSSVIIEASIFKVPSIIMSNIGKEYYQDYIKKERAFVVESTEDLIDAIRNNSVNLNYEADYFRSFDVPSILKEQLNLAM